MSARAGQWELLGYDSDPVPGDPWEVGVESRHYTGVAESISTQISRLKELANPDTRLKGQYADGLTDACSDLADHLGKIENRFRTAGSQLNSFESDLTTARTGTMNALHAAEEVKHRLDTAPEADPDAPPAPFVDHYAEAKSTAHSAMSTFNDRAEEVASKIRDASDDDMLDSGWDKFKDFVSKIAGVLDAFADILGWIATILVVISLFIPGLNLLVAAAILLGLALAAHLLLATTGNGSWLDVAFDVIGIATLGVGTTAASAARVGRAATLTAAANRAAPKAASQFLARASFNGGRGLLGGAHSFLLRTFSPTVKAGMRQAADDAFRAWTARTLPTTTLRNALAAGGDHSLAALAKDHALLLRELGEAAIDPRYTQGLTRALAATRTGAVSGLIPQLSNPKIGPYWEGWNLPPYVSLSDALTITIGGPF